MRAPGAEALTAAAAGREGDLGWADPGRGWPLEFSSLFQVGLLGPPTTVTVGNLSESV